MLLYRLSTMCSFGKPSLATWNATFLSKKNQASVLYLPISYRGSKLLSFSKPLGESSSPKCSGIAGIGSLNFWVPNGFGSYWVTVRWSKFFCCREPSWSGEEISSCSSSESSFACWATARFIPRSTDLLKFLRYSLFACLAFGFQLMYSYWSTRGTLC